MRRLHPRLRSSARLMRDLGSGTFTPTQISAVSAWLRLATSVDAGGEWDSVDNVLNVTNPAIQVDTDRRPAYGTSASGLRTLGFDGSDMLVWPLNAANNSTTKLGIACWVNFAAVAAADQILFAIFNAAGGASVRKFQTGIATSGLRTSVWISSAGGTGRNINTAAGVVTAGAWGFFRIAYDSSVGGDACVSQYWNEVLIAQSGNSNIGAGGTLGVMENPTGNAVIGSQDDQDSPVRALVNGTLIGANIFVMNDNLTAPQGLALMNFEKPA